MPDEIIGRFYFKQTSNGNLIGEFSNHQSDQIFTESADLKSAKGNLYIGKYNSTWQENGKSPCFANLEILPRNGSGKIFSLTWSENNGTPIFRGEGMLCDSIMIGDYQSVPKQMSPQPVSKII